MYDYQDYIFDTKTDSFITNKKSKYTLMNNYIGNFNYISK